MKNLSVPIFVSSCILFLSSCVNLKAVNSFAATSVASVAQYDDLKYNFQHYCNVECHLSQIKASSIDLPLCKCAIYKTADSVTMVIYNRIKFYLIGIEKLSNHAATDYKFDTLENAITTGNYGTMSVNVEDVKSYSAITNIITKTFTDGYRRGKLKEYVGEANKPLQALLKALQTIIGENLFKEAELEKDAIEDYYKTRVALADSMPKNAVKGDSMLINTIRVAYLLKYAKGKALEEYFDKLDNLNNTETQLKLFAKNLQAIAVGHQQLYNNRDAFAAKDLFKALAQNISNMQIIYTEIKQLKN